MKRNIILTIGLLLQLALASGQEFMQTVRGKLTDSDSKLPLIGATVMINGTTPKIGTVTNAEGNYRLENVPIGRITLEISYLGYESKTISHIEVTSGKEVIFNLEMHESAHKMEEVVVKATKNKGEAINDMALLSARSISVEESKRYAGGFVDPSRIVSNFAGAANTPDGSSDIIVRGNAPKYMQWQLEGVEISSPYHFDDQNASFGGLTALNNNLLEASDFYTGAFAPEYGNVLSSVFDVRLKAGNNEKFEGSVGLGLLGTDVTLEGPVKAGYGGSYLLNYRYSTASLISELGLIDINGIPSYQDATLKIVLPTRNIGSFSLFALGGLSGTKIEDIAPEMASVGFSKSVYEDIQKDYDKGNYLLNTGLNHTLPINRRSYLKSTLSFSGNGISDKLYESKRVFDTNGEPVSDSTYNKRQTFDNNIQKSAYRASVTYHNKINAKHKIQIGTKYSIMDYEFEQSMVQPETDSLFTVVDFKEQIPTFENFISWKYRVSENFSIVTGIHNLNVIYNKKSTLEPRIAASWNLNQKNSFSAGYGNHSNMESIHHYFAKVKQENGGITEPNKNLGLLRAHHFVLGYERRFSKNLMAKVELYYQYLYNLPVENLDTSYFATINEGLEYRYLELVNKGTGKNYGAEITIERFFDGNYFFMVNASLFNSAYQSLEGVERNTRYNNTYLTNLLVGKEFHGLGRKENQTMSLNARAFFQGGQKYIPLLRNSNGDLMVDPENNEYYDYEKAFNESLDKVFQLNISFSYIFNRENTAHEIFIDLLNVTNNTARINEYYNESEPNSIGYVRQFGFFPNLMYKLYF
ncbi:MAG: carboxypeptidase-like regulatory domain-containing protein [Bacteroidota bacterium]|nr:MAG: carboxypeptidase-like regulatory domain-containing protein [Bacteroidota bacterium]